MDNLRIDTAENLKAAIKNMGLEKYTEQLLNIARETIRVVATSPIDTQALGQSRIGGAPDLENIKQWPVYGYGDNKNQLSVFYFQINLSDLPQLATPKLPTNGLLSLYSTSQNQLEDDGTVLFFRDVNNLSSQKLPDIKEFGDKDLDLTFNTPACFSKPRKIEFETSISLPGYLYCPDFIEEDDLDNYLELEALYPHKLDGEELGFMYSYYCQGMPEEDDSEWFTLLNLHSDSKYFNFGDCGNCGISAKRKSAESGDFKEALFNYCEY
jgi:uncharacterized protein YwqG